jgi:hypothetical protein
MEAVYIRSKIAKGRTYYQIVEGARDGPKVRQRIVVALGPTPDPAEALKEMRRGLRLLRTRRGRWPRDYKPESKTLARRLERLDVQIGELESRIETLAGIIRKRLIGTTPKRKDG